MKIKKTVNETLKLYKSYSEDPYENFNKKYKGISFPYVLKKLEESILLLIKDHPEFKNDKN